MDFQSNYSTTIGGATVQATGEIAVLNPATGLQIARSNS